MSNARRPRETKPGIPVLLVDESEEASLRAIEQLTAAKVRFEKVEASVHDKRAFRIPAILSVYGFVEGPDAAERFIETLALVEWSPPPMNAETAE